MSQINNGKISDSKLVEQLQILITMAKGRRKRD